MRRKQDQIILSKPRTQSAKQGWHSTRSTSLQKQKKTGAHFTLYSDSELDDKISKKVQLKKNVQSHDFVEEIFDRAEADILTQVQLQTSKMKLHENSENQTKNNLLLEKLDDYGFSTVFNKRLISSTPDPERLEVKDCLDSEPIESNSSLQLIPERDCCAGNFPDILSSVSNISDRWKDHRSLGQHQLTIKDISLSSQNATANSDPTPIQVSKAEWTEEKNCSDTQKSLIASLKSSEGYCTLPLSLEIPPQPNVSASSSKTSTFKHNLNSAFLVPSFSDSNLVHRATEEFRNSGPAIMSKFTHKKINAKKSKFKAANKSIINMTKGDRIEKVLNVEECLSLPHVSFESQATSDFCDLEVSTVNSVAKVKKNDSKGFTGNMSASAESSSVSQIIEFLKANPLNENKELQYKKIIERVETDLEVKENDQADLPILTETTINSELEKVMIDSTNQDKKITKEAEDSQFNESSTKSGKNYNDVNQNYNSDSDIDSTHIRHQQPKKLLYLESMADPTLRNIACRLSFKATALRDIELRDLIDDMIYYTDAALGKENRRAQSNHFNLKEENFNLNKKIDTLLHQLEASELQERKCAKLLETTQKEVLHIEKKVIFLKEEKEKLENQVTSLLNERASWLGSQQDLVKTISLKDRELLKLNEKHYQEKKLLHESLERISKNAQGVHKKLSGADREIEKLQQRLKCKELDIDDLKEKLLDTENKFRDCETDSLRKEKEIIRLQDLLDSLRLGVDHVLQAFDSSYSSFASTAQQQGIENLRMMMHPELYRPENSTSTRKKQAVFSPDEDVSIFKKPDLYHRKNAKEYHQDKKHTESSFQYDSLRNTSKPQNVPSGLSRLTSQALEKHNQILSPLDPNFRLSSDRQAVDETYFSDTEVNLHHDQPSHVSDRIGYDRNSRGVLEYMQPFYKHRRKSESDIYNKQKSAQVHMSAESQAKNSDDFSFTVPAVQSLEEISIDTQNGKASGQHQTHLSHYSQQQPLFNSGTQVDNLPYSSLKSEPIPKTDSHNSKAHSQDNNDGFFSTLRSETISSDLVFPDGKSFSARHVQKNQDTFGPIATSSPKDSDTHQLYQTCAQSSSIFDRQSDNKSFPAPHSSRTQNEILNWRSQTQYHLPRYDFCEVPVTNERQHRHHPHNVHFEDESSLKNLGYSEDSQFIHGGTTVVSSDSPLNTSDTSISRRATKGFGSPPQEELYQGAEISMSSSSIVDTDLDNHSRNNNKFQLEDRFTTGIASLDEKIAKLQKKINRTKAIFTK